MAGDSGGKTDLGGMVFLAHRAGSREQKTLADVRFFRIFELRSQI
jgi:hypothetical protein